MDAMDEIRQTFFQECEEQLAELETGLRAIKAGDTEIETANVVFRAVHSIKGGAAAFDLNDLVQFARAFETMLDGLRTGRFAADPPLVKLMLRAAALLADLVQASRDGTPADLKRSGALMAKISAATLKRTGGAAGQPAKEDEAAFEFTPTMIDLSDFADLVAATPAHHRITFRPHPELYAKGNETATLMRELGRLGPIAVACDISDLPSLDDLDPEGAYLAWTVDLTDCTDLAAITDIFDFVEWDSDLGIEGVADTTSIELAA